MQVEIFSEFPYSAIGLVEIHKRNGKYGRCTGFIIDKDMVLTANHCLFEGDVSFKKGLFVPAFSPQAEFHDGWRITHVLKQEKHFKNFDLDNPYETVQWDYAFLIVAKKNGISIGEKYGILEFTDKIYPSQKVRAVGYPSKFGSNMIETFGKIISYGYTEEEITCVEKFKIGYSPIDCEKATLIVDIDLYQGNSGGPLLSMEGKVISLLSVVFVDQKISIFPVLLDNPEFLSRWNFAKKITSG